MLISNFLQLPVSKEDNLTWWEYLGITYAAVSGNVNPLLNEDVGSVGSEWESTSRVRLSPHDEDGTAAWAHTDEFRMD